MVLMGCRYGLYW